MLVDVGWVGLHVISVQCLDSRRIKWSCRNCPKQWCNRNKVVETMCENHDGCGSINIPSVSQKSRLWAKWEKAASRALKLKLKEDLAVLSEAIFRVNQANNDAKWPGEAPKPLGGLQIVRSNTEEPKVWWKCALCDFVVENF